MKEDEDIYMAVAESMRLMALIHLLYLMCGITQSVFK